MVDSRPESKETEHAMILCEGVMVGLMMLSASFLIAMWRGGRIGLTVGLEVGLEVELDVGLAVGLALGLAVGGDVSW
jgi:hypothetical protein